MALDKGMDTHTLALIIAHSPKFPKSFRTVQAAALLLREDGLEYNGPACCPVTIHPHVACPHEDMKQ